MKSPETAAAASAPQPPFSLVGSRVLLAEDNPLNAEIAQAVLKMSSIDVDVVHDGEECVHTMEVMPALMASESISSDSCMVRAPSSTPGRIWQCTSRMAKGTL